MVDALDSFLQAKGIDKKSFHKNSSVGRLFREEGVEDSSELKRIVALPRYRWQDDEDLDTVTKFIREEFGKPKIYCNDDCVCGGTGEMFTFSVQTAALSALYDYGGALLFVPVGGGKTLISWLAGSVVDSERTLLLVPAKLIPKTKREFKYLERHWRKPKRLHIISYELLARDRGVSELEAFKPDLIIADEAHKLKSTNAACTKIVRAYLQGTKNCRYLDMSGTSAKRSIKEYYHRAKWALPPELLPLPKDFNHMRDWSDALDEKVSGSGRLKPGALVNLMTPEERARYPKISKGHQIALARDAYGRRLSETPGVIISNEDSADGSMSLFLKAVKWDTSVEVIQAFEGLRKTWELPDGHPIETPIQLWRVARCLTQGFYYRWFPDPPKDWLEARREWSATVRQVLKRFRDIKRPVEVARQISEGRISWARDSYETWIGIRDSYKPQKRTHWIDDHAFEFCKKWAKRNRSGIIWVDEKALGKRLYEEAGIPYYAAQGLCEGSMIEDEKGVCVASIKANGEGRNLQHFHKNLIVGPPPGGAVWEQLMGRTHRRGQKADAVDFEVAIGCYENWRVMVQAIRDADFAKRTSGLPQKLKLADVDIIDVEAVQKLAATGSPLWDKENAEFFEEDEKWSESEDRFSSMTSAERAVTRR